MRTVIQVEGVGKRYKIGELVTYGMLRESIMDAVTRPFRRDRSQRERQEIWAIRDVSFGVAEGEIVGIIGRNGAGKSTLLKILSQITDPTEGKARLTGRIGSLLEVGTGFHPELTGRENIYLNGAILGMRRAETRARLDEIVAFAEVDRFLDTPVKRYSSGMLVRLAFAVAAHLEPEIMLVDEVLAVGDAEFQKKCMGRMEDVSRSGRTILFVSHSMPAVLRLCPRVILLERGRVAADGAAKDVIRAYLDTGLGTSAARAWRSPAEAPGDDVIRLRAVRIVDAKGAVTDSVDVTQDFSIEVDYDLRSDRKEGPIGVSLTFWNEDGVMLFATSSVAEAPPGPQRGSNIRAICDIPGNLLAEGQITINVQLVSKRPDTLHGAERDVVAFHVVDRSEGRGARGDIAGEWPGVMRPKLAWRVGDARIAGSAANGGDG